MNEREIVLLGWSDYVGITRCRGIPAAELSGRLEDGLGWAAAGQALTPFADIAPNPWGPMKEVRQVPVPETRTRVDLWEDVPALHFYLCDSRNPDGSTWDCCTRGFMNAALADFKRETGLDFIAAFEHEFTLIDPSLPQGPPFSMEAVRNAAAFTGDVSAALTAAGVEPETVEPEYGYLQYEVTTAPAKGSMAGDRAIITREVIREVARRRGQRATFSPKPTPDGVGNGAHMHFSFLDAEGRNAAFDADRPEAEGAAGASVVAQRFIAGVLRHMRALTALVAPSPVSYLRLGPHHWSCGYASFGIQNREAAIRICPSPSRDPEKAARGFNMEFRPPDATASPYMVVGALIRAGLEGIRDELPLPAACDQDPADLSEAEREALGIVPLPSSLAEALDALDADQRARTWLPDLMSESYVAVKRAEIALTDPLDPADVCRRYRDAY
ncbi:MAG: glutamine synthetase [Chloroflexi bacterium]|nr:glutamine synthetase [Chloroflexota bacterium]